MSTQQITATQVQEGRRLAFLPRLFGRHMLYGETLVYRWLDNLSDDYKGGYWEFYDLSNGGGYMAPAHSSELELQVEGNGYSGSMTADAAGIVACLFALGELVASVQQPTDRDRLADLYHTLRDFASQHPERQEIMQAID